MLVLSPWTCYHRRMTKADRVRDLVTAPLEFLDVKWDKALLGFAEKITDTGKIVKPCYGYQALKALLKHKHYIDAYGELRRLISNREVVILHKINTKSLWSSIYDSKFPRWELLDSAILGLIYSGWECCGICYNKMTVINCLTENHALKEQSEFQQEVHSTTMLESSILPLYLGEYSPWYLTPIQ